MADILCYGLSIKLIAMTLTIFTAVQVSTKYYEEKLTILWYFLMFHIIFQTQDRADRKGQRLDGDWHQGRWTQSKRASTRHRILDRNNWTESHTLHNTRFFVAICKKSDQLLFNFMDWMTIASRQTLFILRLRTNKGGPSKALLSCNFADNWCIIEALKRTCTIMIIDSEPHSAMWYKGQKFQSTGQVAGGFS